MLIVTVKAPASGTWRLELHGAGLYCATAHLEPAGDGPRWSGFDKNHCELVVDGTASKVQLEFVVAKDGASISKAALGHCGLPAFRTASPSPAWTRTASRSAASSGGCVGRDAFSCFAVSYSPAAVGRHDRVIFEKGYGFANAERRVPFTSGPASSAGVSVSGNHPRAPSLAQQRNSIVHRLSCTAGLRVPRAVAARRLPRLKARPEKRSAAGVTPRRW